MTYANWPQRVGAYLIDIVPAIVLELIGSVFALRAAIIYYLFLLAALAWQVYNRWIQGGKGQSLGKKVLGLKLVSASTGAPIGTGMAFVRDIAHIVDSIICFIGYLFPLWDAKRQTIADKIVSTVVVPA